jgi:AP-1 complex subunit gamma-1
LGGLDGLGGLGGGMGGTAPSLFGSSPASAPAPTNATSAGSAAQKVAGYLAYDKNALKIILKPQVSAQKPGVVLVTATFEATGGQPIQGINFQAAVPKVCRRTLAIALLSEIETGLTAHL